MLILQVDIDLFVGQRVSWFDPGGPMEYVIPRCRAAGQAARKNRRVPEMKLQRRAANVADQVFKKKEFSEASCLCGAVRMQIDIPARWAWHDHSRASRLAHGAAYATYVGSWRKRFRILSGQRKIKAFSDIDTGTTRHFCASCGTPVFYERAHSPHMVNIPRALFSTRTGREPLYHIGILEMRDWAYVGAPLAPLTGFPGVVWQRPSKKKV